MSPQASRQRGGKAVRESGRAKPPATSSPLPRPMPTAKRVWFRVSWLALGLLFKGVNRLTISGTEHLPPGGGVLLAANHLSIFDTLLIPWANIAAVGLEVVWAPAKAEIFEIPVVNRIIRSWGAFPVLRGGRDLRAMRRLVELMQHEKVMLFPEGTRSADGQLGPGNRALGKLIYLARPRVIPTAIFGTDHLLPKGRVAPRLFGTLEVRFGPAVELESLYAARDTKGTAEAIVREVMRGIARVQGEEAAWLARFPA